MMRIVIVITMVVGRGENESGGNRGKVIRGEWLWWLVGDSEENKWESYC